MKTVQLYDQNGISFLGSDGIMKIDGRFGRARIEETIRDRNKKFSVNFPHKIAFYYSVISLGRGGRFGNSITQKIKL